MALNFSTSIEDARLIDQIADRIMASTLSPYEDKITACTDITATHCNGNPLHLSLLLGAPPADFFHDVVGISQHLNRETGKLEHLFEPRCSARS